jgi:hypothetical protein
MRDFLDEVKAIPLKSVLISIVLVFPLVTPLIVQEFLNYSAIKASFGITVAYFVVWNIYQKRDEIRSRLGS